MVLQRSTYMHLIFRVFNFHCSAYGRKYFNGENFPMYGKLQINFIRHVTTKQLVTRTHCYTLGITSLTTTAIVPNRPAMGSTIPLNWPYLH